MVIASIEKNAWSTAITTIALITTATITGLRIKGQSKAAKTGIRMLTIGLAGLGIYYLYKLMLILMETMIIKI